MALPWVRTDLKGYEYLAECVPLAPDLLRLVLKGKRDDIEKTLSGH